MKILDLDSQVFLAPMAGITDRPMRSLVSSFGGGNIVSEMVAVNALERRNPKSYKIADVRDENYPVIVQLVGGEAKLFSDAARLVEELGAYSIDINMGCPVKKIVNNNSGSSLMKNLKLASEIIKTTIAATPLKVSVKFRKGWDHSTVNAVEFAKMCEDSGASHITVHGRTRSDFYGGKADWDIIAEIKSSVTIPVIGNGDVVDVRSAKKMLDYTNVDGIMVGRATLGSPWLVADIDKFLKTGSEPDKKTADEVKAILLLHLKELVSYYGDKTALPLSRKYVCWYSKGLRDAKRFREAYMKIDNYEEALREINNYFDGNVEFIEEE